MNLRNKQVPISTKNSRAARNAHARAKEAFKTYDTSAIVPKRSKLPYAIGIGVAVVVAIVVVILLVTLTSCSFVEPLPDGEPAIVTVSEGESASQVADELLDKRLITSKGSFLDVVKAQNATSSIMPGVYLFHGGDTPSEMLEALMIGPSATGIALTIPEGQTRVEIADTIDSLTEGRVSAQSFLDATSDASEYASEFPFLDEVSGKSLEGFLYPKTYTITADMDAAGIARMMLSQYGLETADVDWAASAAEGLSEYETLILASVIEKESDAENMGKVSSVFHNRLKSDHPYLEADATTAYIVGRAPTGEEVHADDPYSTYSNPGLPPTPICNPSLAAIDAAINPENTNYMYFYTDSNQQTTFSRTFQEHQNAYN